jgi:hypothetical protein
MNGLHIPLNVYLAEYRSRASLSTAMAANCCVFEHVDSLWPLTLYSQLVVICTARFIIQKFYTLPAQCICVWFLWISAKTEIICLYRMNWLDFVTDTVFTARYVLKI